MAWAGLLCLIIFFTLGSAETSRSSFLYTKEPIRLDLKLNVVLVGLNGDGAFEYKVDAASLSSLLSTALPSYRPSLVEEHRPLNVEYALHYDVHHQRNIDTFTRLLGEELRKLGPPEGGATTTDWAVSELGSLRAFFESITVADEYSIILLNPCKRALNNARTGAASTTIDPLWQYHYNYSGGPTQSWVSEGRYVVVDLSAGPVVYGPSDAGEGAVSGASLPRIDKFHHKLKKSLGRTEFYKHYTVSDFAEIQAHLATTAISAIQHVFAPDIRFPAVQADKVLIPIIVLRNHVDFNPWHKGSRYSIDLNTVRREVAKLALPNQEVTIVTDLHGLHEHKHIALALAKAHKTDTLHELNVLGRYTVKEKPYIDGRALLQQMKDAQDIITTGFLQSAEERAHLSAFFSRSQPAMPEGPDSGSEKVGQARPLGTRILPVYVFSLLLSPHLQDALLDRHSLHTASAEGVIVLQTNATEVPVPFFARDSPVVLYPNDPTRHVIAGIATALGALNSPLQRYSPLHSRLLQSHLWASGHHPFGPYTSTTGISHVFVDLVVRNAVLSRLDQALKKVHKAIAKVDRFAKRYLYDPFGENVTMAGVKGSTVGSGTEFAGSMADLEHGSAGPELWQGWDSERTSTFRPLPVSTVERLYGEMDRLESMFRRIGGLLRDHKLREAYEVSSSVELGAVTFSQYVRDEIRAAEAELICCVLHHTPTHSSPVGDILQYLLVFVVAVLFMLALVVFLKKQPRAKQSLQSRR